MKSRIRNRHVLRSKDSNRLISQLGRHFGLDLAEVCLETATVDGSEVILFEGGVFGFWLDDDAIPSVRALLKLNPSTGYVTVDMGAVSFVVNGADIMTPGIVDADPSIVVGSLVWVRDEKNGRPLAVGRALMPGPDMKSETKGKAVKNIHYVGDRFWNLEI